MSDRPQHTIILPYFCREEVERYLTIAQQLSQFPKPKCDVTFLLASSPKTETDQELVDAYSKLGKTVAFACPTQSLATPKAQERCFGTAWNTCKQTAMAVTDLAFGWNRTWHR